MLMLFPDIGPERWEEKHDMDKARKSAILLVSLAVSIRTYIVLVAFFRAGVFYQTIPQARVPGKKRTEEEIKKIFSLKL